MKELLYRSVVDVDAACEGVLESIRPTECEQAGIINAFGRTLAEDVTSGADLPSHDVAAMDGYAAISSDTRRATKRSPRSVSVMSDAASAKGKTLSPGTVMCVRAGDPLPTGADTVVQTNDTYRPQGGPEVLIMAETKCGTNVVAAGTVASSGEVVISKGTVVGARDMGLMASLGMHGAPVRRRPRVAIVTTGAGIVDIVDELAPGEVRNSARYALVGMVLDSGCDLGALIHARGGREGLQRALEECSGSDAIIVANAPDENHDLALAALVKVGAAHFERVQMEPGAATGFGTVHERPTFIIPGDAVVEVFEALVRPGLLAMLGRTHVHRRRARAVLGKSLKLNPGPRHYIRAALDCEHDRYVVSACGVGKGEPQHGAVCGQVSASDTKRRNSIIVVGEHLDFVRRGETVEVIPLED